MSKHVTLYTAGMDSFILQEWLIQSGIDSQPVYFNHGGRYCEHELQNILKQDLSVVEDDSISLKDLETSDAHIPNRNIIFALMAASRYADNIWIGGSLSDRVEDNNQEVMNQFSTFLSNMNGRHIKIDSPFYDCYKENMVDWYISNAKTDNPKQDLITKTFSCFNPVDHRTVSAKIDVNHRHPEFVEQFNVEVFATQECLNCTACFRKNAVLSHAGIYLPFNNKDIIEKYKNSFQTALVATPRSKATLEYIRRLES